MRRVTRTAWRPANAQLTLSIEEKRQAQGLPEFSVESGPLWLLHLKNPDHAALGNVIADPDIGLRQFVLDALGVDAPARLDRDVFGTIDVISDRSAGDAGIGLLLPQHVSGLGVESAEHAVISAADKDEVAAGSQHGGHKLPPEIMLPRLFAGGRIPGLQLTVVIRARAHG